MTRGHWAGGAAAGHLQRQFDNDRKVATFSLKNRFSVSSFERLTRAAAAAMAILCGAKTREWHF